MSQIVKLISELVEARKTIAALQERIRELEAQVYGGTTK